MSNQPTEMIGLSRVQDDMVFLHALTNLPFGNAMKNTCNHNSNLAFSPDCCKLPKKFFERNSNTTEDTIEASLDYTQKLEPFNHNLYLDKLAKHLKAHKMHHCKNNTPPRQQAGGAL
jgi:hypothetical protein